MFRVISLSILLVVLSLAALAQAPTGIITGTVTTTAAAAMS